jgi:hypothetical protein
MGGYHLAYRVTYMYIPSCAPLQIFFA